MADLGVRALTLPIKIQPLTFLIYSLPPIHSRQPTLPPPPPLQWSLDPPLNKNTVNHHQVAGLFSKLHFLQI